MPLYRNVFLADDDPEDQEIFQDALRTIEPSIVCFFANNGEKALQVLDSDILEKPDLIFLDLNMPFLNGKQVLERIKAIDALRSIPVIMYSTHFNERDVEDFKGLGAAHYLVKPAVYNKLVEALRAILEQKW